MPKVSFEYLLIARMMSFFSTLLNLGSRSLPVVCSSAIWSKSPQSISHSDESNDSASEQGEMKIWSDDFRLLEFVGEAGDPAAVALPLMLKLCDENVFSVSEQTPLTVVLATTATATVVAKAGPVRILSHQVSDLLWFAAVQGNNKNKKTITCTTERWTINRGRRDDKRFRAALRPFTSWQPKNKLEIETLLQTQDRTKNGAVTTVTINCNTNTTE